MLNWDVLKSSINWCYLLNCIINKHQLSMDRDQLDLPWLTAVGITRSALADWGMEGLRHHHPRRLIRIVWGRPATEGTSATNWVSDDPGFSAMCSILYILTGSPVVLRVIPKMLVKQSAHACSALDLGPYTLPLTSSGWAPKQQFNIVWWPLAFWGMKLKEARKFLSRYSMWWKLASLSTCRVF